MYLTPTQLMEKYPDVHHKLNWTASDIGTLMRSKLITGYYSRNKRVTMVEECSLLHLIAFANTVLDHQLLTPNDYGTTT
jgi:hypothetical protein